MRVLLSVCCVLGMMFGGLASAAAQQPEGAVHKQQPSRTDKESLWEDMEVLSRLTEGAVRELYGKRSGKIMFGAGVNSDAGVVGEVWVTDGAKIKPMSVASQSQFGLSSAYLPGYGIILQMELPPLRPATASTTGEATVCPFMSKSPWERERERLRGRVKDCQNCHEAGAQTLWQLNAELKRRVNAAEISGYSPDTTDARHQAPTRDQLVDRLLKLLAENGHHVHELHSDEFIAIAIEFRDERPALISSSTPVQPGADSDEEDELLGIEISPPTPQAELEGDLFLRQGNHKAAIEAFERAMRANAGDDFVPTSLLKKLAQAHLGAGNLERARAALDELAHAKRQNTDSSADSTETPALRFPARLILLASAGALRQVGTGEATFHQLQGWAQVKYFEPHANPGDSQPPADNSESTANDDSADKK